MDIQFCESVNRLMTSELKKIEETQTTEYRQAVSKAQNV